MNYLTFALMTAIILLSSPLCMAGKKNSMSWTDSSGETQEITTKSAAPDQAGEDLGQTQVRRQDATAKREDEAYRQERKETLKKINDVVDDYKKERKKQQRESKKEFKAWKKKRLKSINDDIAYYKKKLRDSNENETRKRCRKKIKSLQKDKVKLKARKSWSD